MKWYVDGAGWNGRYSRSAVANEQENFPVVKLYRQYTNNEMEYKALINALERASEGDQIFSDSLLIVNQVKQIGK